MVDLSACFHAICIICAVYALLRYVNGESQILNPTTQVLLIRFISVPTQYRVFACSLVVSSLNSHHHLQAHPSSAATTQSPMATLPTLQMSVDMNFFAMDILQTEAGLAAAVSHVEAWLQQPATEFCMFLNELISIPDVVPLILSSKSLSL